MTSEAKSLSYSTKYCFLWCSLPHQPAQQDRTVSATAHHPAQSSSNQRCHAGDILANLVATFAAARPPLFVVDEGHNTIEVTKTLFAAFGRHISLWPKATTIERPQIAAHHSIIAPGPLIQLTHSCCYWSMILLQSNKSLWEQQIIRNAVAQKKATKLYKHSGTTECNKSF